ncbi:MAG: hypothetical protein Q8K58_02540 [Acidimicrobiales bacterium]|nr:hypothetical protein [Acidimicrobiales bacterium]
MAHQPPYDALEQALAILAYQWRVHGDEVAALDEIAAVEALARAASAFPQTHVPLAELYPAVARLAALSVGVLASLGDPDEVDGLTGFEGFHLWRDSR